MKILLIPDKFKGSLTAKEVARALVKGLKQVQPLCDINSVVASDGGDGFLDAISAVNTCDSIKVKSVDPLGRPLLSEYLFDSVQKSAYIELAKTSGLTLLKGHKNNIMQASTYGTGLVIKDAILRKCKSIYLGLGGSATNDAGIGIAKALGFYFLDENNEQLPASAEHLSNIKSIHKKSNSLPLNEVSFFAVNDVANPLFGANGAAYTYAKQKGASAKAIEKLDKGLRDFDEVVNKIKINNFAAQSGSGAAGGTAYGLKVFCDAEFISGTDFLFKIAKVEELMKNEGFDYIVTGEGKLDKQTAHGKLIKGVVDLGIRFNVPVIVVCGKFEAPENDEVIKKTKAILEIHKPSFSEAYSMLNASRLIQQEIATYFAA